MEEKLYVNLDLFEEIPTVCLNFLRESVYQFDWFDEMVGSTSFKLTGPSHPTALPF